MNIPIEYRDDGRMKRKLVVTMVSIVAILIVAWTEASSDECAAQRLKRQTPRGPREIKLYDEQMND